jgi:CheY-like chemotaxis protein
VFLAGTYVAVELPRAIEAVLERAIGLAGEKPVAVIAEYPAHLPAVEGEQERLTEIIASLVAQMIAVLDHGEIYIGAELLAAGESPQIATVLEGKPNNLSRGGPWALVRVMGKGATGMGRDLASLRDSYHRTQEQPRVARDGYSLKTCRDIVEGYGGDLWIELIPEQGFRLNIALPLRAARYGNADLGPLYRMVETKLPEGDEAVKVILLMAEEEPLRDFLSQNLAKAGYRVLPAYDGANVLALARSEKPDLILLDLEARDPPGFDVAMVLKQDSSTRDIPVLFISSIMDPDVGMRMGAVNILVRSEGTGKLLSAIESVLESGISPSARVLVIESNDNTREMIIHWIQSLGYRVTEARGAEEAIALAERLAPGLVLINSKLARDRDYWLLRSLRQFSHDMDIYIMAEAITDEEGKAAVSRGASGYSQTGRLRELLDTVRDRKGGLEN